MNRPWLTLIFCGLAFGYGLSMLVLRIRRPQSLPQLMAMRERHGAAKGSFYFLLLYSLFPLMVGLVLFLQWISGAASL